MIRRNTKKLIVLAATGSLMAFGGVVFSPSTASAEAGKEEQGQRGVQQIEKISTTAEVTKIDKDKREVTLQGPKGEKVNVQVPEQNAAALKNVKEGDKVRVDYVEALALQMSKAGEPSQPGISVQEVKKRLPEGAVVGREVETTVEVTKVDTKENEITIKGPRGVEHDIQVIQPAMQDRLSELKKGDRLKVRYMEAVALKLESTGKSKG